MFANQLLVRELLGLEASAFLTKNASSRDLAATVRSVTHVPPGTPDNVTVAMLREDFDAEEPVESNLSRRELQVLCLASRGMGNKEVANTLHLSEATIKRNLSNVYGKLDVNYRGEAASKAISEGWISSWDLVRDE